MGIMNYLEHGFSSLLGNGLSLVTGHGIDQEENYYRPDDAGQKPDIYINADKLDLQAGTVNVNEQAAEAAPMIEPAQDINARAWSGIEHTPEPAAPQYDDRAAAYREAAFNRAMQENDDGITLSR